jgi:serine protease Do
MYQKFISIVKREKLMAFFLLTIFSVAAFSGCSRLNFQSGENSAKPESTPLQPVVVDGIRTSYADIVDRVASAVVKINVEQRVKTAPQAQSPFEEFFKDFQQSPQQQQLPQQRPQIERGLGSGVIVSADGTILTNQHVVSGADKIRVELNDKRIFEAKVVGSDQPSDLAVLKIEAIELPFLNFSDSDKVRVGDIVLAIGNPLGIGQSVTEGIISAKGRRTGISDGSFEDFLQTDAPINRGNSGGALINLSGELIGINSQILSPSGGSIGIGFSIPSNMAKSVMEQLLKDGKVRRGQLGVFIQNITEDLAKTLELKETRGVIVSGVKPGGSGERAGIKRGDVIIAVNGEKIEDSNTLRNKVAGTAPGSEATITVVRNGNEQQLKTKLDEFDAETGKRENSESNGNSGGANQGGKLGLNLQPLTPDFAQRLRLPAETKGLIVTEVDPGGAAAEEGVAKGDVIMEINRQPVETLEDAQSALDKAGDKPTLLLVARGGQTVYMTIQPKN